MLTKWYRSIKAAGREGYVSTTFISNLRNTNHYLPYAMNPSIDFEKSIRYERLIYRGTSRQRTLIFLGRHFRGILLLAASLLFFTSAVMQGSRLLIAAATLPLALFAVSMALINKLVKVEGTELRKNQTEIFALLLRVYPGIQRHNCSPQVIIITKERRQLSPDKEIIILLEDRHVYMNISMFGRGNIKYLLFAIPNYFKSRSVLRHFYKRKK